MGESKKMKVEYCRIMAVIGFISIMLLSNSVRCEDYIVGGEQGWNSDTNFGAWSKDFNFTVGDILVFNYPKEEHNVYEVTERAYRTCDTRSGVIAKYESGNDKVNLNKQKKYWFLCNVVGHCLGGMRFHIDVKSINSTNSTLLLAPPLSSSSNTPLPSFYLTFFCFFSFFHFVILFNFFSSLFIFF